MLASSDAVKFLQKKTKTTTTTTTTTNKQKRVQADILQALNKLSMHKEILSCLGQIP
jgi:hypothetical protein